MIVVGPFQLELFYSILFLSETWVSARTKQWRRFFSMFLLRFSSTNCDIGHFVTTLSWVQNPGSKCLMEAASNMQTPLDCKLSSTSSEIATSTMHLALTLQATYETEFLGRKVSLASNFKGSSEQDISTGDSRTEGGQANTSAMYSIA